MRSYELPKLPLFMDLKKIQELFCLKRTKILKLIKLGEIKARKDGKYWLVESKSFLDHLDRCDPRIPNVKEITGT